MGKSKLDWIEKTILRCGDNWGQIIESHYKCPICNSKLYTAKTGYGLDYVMDGNTVYHCSENEHTFFETAWDNKMILYLSEDASETSTNYEKKFELIDNKWV